MAVVGKEMEHVDNNGRGGGWGLPSFCNSVHLDTENLAYFYFNLTLKKICRKHRSIQESFKYLVQKIF